MYTLPLTNPAIVTTSATDKTVYTTCAPSKLHERKSGSMHVEFVNFFGKKTIIPCKNRTQLKAASEFLAMFKRESTIINTICAQYAVKNGKFVNRPQLKRELVAAGLSPKAVNMLTVMN